ncbi:hypothetical protein DFP72DRAFT_1164293 [Ephemerocybe angulata]|uniref:Uncharacterized protein n=1 Tax=Ephemerocybe angulata TaxID=980116 RepID=A0A8H6IE62_9AGAR|nr:hypothetical protein DFP72DRAFT_1164293 [Tulosesus angulatus]
MLLPPANANIQTPLSVTIALLSVLAFLPGSNHLWRRTLVLVNIALTVFYVYATKGDDPQMDYTNMPWITTNCIPVAVVSLGNKDVSEMFKKKRKSSKGRKMTRRS